MDIKGHVVEVVWIEQASDIAEEYYASLHARPRGQEAPRHALGAGRRRDRAGRRGEPRRDRQDPRRPGRRPDRGRSAASGSTAAKLNPAATDGAVDILLKLYTRLRRRRRRPRRDQPADPHARRARCTRSTPRSPSTTTPMFRHPDYERVRRDPGARRARAGGARARACSTSGSTATSASSPTAPGSP